MKKILVNTIITIMSIAAVIFLIYGIQIVDNLFLKIIVIITSIAYGFIFLYYIWKQN